MDTESSTQFVYQHLPIDWILQNHLVAQVNAYITSAAYWGFSSAEIIGHLLASSS